LILLAFFFGAGIAGLGAGAAGLGAAVVSAISIFADGRDNLIEQTARKLSPLAPNPLVRIKQRVAYKRADLEAKAATEIDKEAAEEIAHLWKQIQRVVRKTDGQTARHEPDAKVVARRAR
jgi:cellulose biosynthesis protein BcsQ